MHARRACFRIDPGASSRGLLSLAITVVDTISMECRSSMDSCSRLRYSEGMNNVTRILRESEAGNPVAAEQLLPLVYEELRKLASLRLANEKPGQTLQATALVHEAYLRLLGRQVDDTWESKGHFFASAAEAMRRILVDRARKQNAAKRGGKYTRVEFDEERISGAGEKEDVVALHEALTRLEQIDEVKAKLVKLRYFAGLTIDQAAEALGIGVSTANKYWSYSKVWLRAEIHGLPAEHR